MSNKQYGDTAKVTGGKIAPFLTSGVEAHQLHSAQERERNRPRKKIRSKHQIYDKRSGEGRIRSPFTIPPARNRVIDTSTV